jgi:hypothetical protein
MEHGLPLPDTLAVTGVRTKFSLPDVGLKCEDIKTGM